MNRAFIRFVNWLIPDRNKTQIDIPTLLVSERVRSTPVLDILVRGELEWKKVNSQPCIHTFYKDYLINLCKWQDGGADTITIYVEEYKTNTDLFQEDISVGDEHYQHLLETYLNRIGIASNVMAELES